jgi:tripartite-type tricarboxylate transporter receptor subunit TctC
MRILCFRLASLSSSFLLSAVCLCGAVSTFAQGYPSKPIRLIVPFTAGGAPDIIARRIGSRMTENWKQQVVVDNRSGAGGTIGVGIVAKATPDGYTLLVHSAAFVISAALHSKLPYDPIKDFAPVSQISIGAGVLAVAPSLGVRSVKELIALAKEKPGGINFGSSGVGSGTHFNSEQFKARAGINTVHVPYKGIPEMLLDTMTGRTHYSFSPLSPALPLIRDGRLIALAVSTARRTPVLPDVPTLAEAALPGYEFQGWFGVFAPAATPPGIVDQISKEIARVVDLPDVKQQFVNNGEEARPSTPNEFTRFVGAELEKYSTLVKLAGIRSE